MMRIAAVSLAIGVGIVILLGYFVPGLAAVQGVLLGWAIILAGSAAVVGVFNLVLVHASKISNRESGRFYSWVLLVCLLGSFLYGMAMGPADPWVRSLVNSVIVPVEASLMALLAVSLVYASVRLLRRRTNAMSIVFLATAVVMLVASAGLPLKDVGIFNDFLRPWMQHVLAMGGARGLLIGIGLGTLTTGLRVLMGTNRPYGAE
jgi:hypothetical protein